MHPSDHLESLVFFSRITSEISIVLPVLRIDILTQPVIKEPRDRGAGRAAGAAQPAAFFFRILPTPSKTEQIPRCKAELACTAGCAACSIVVSDPLAGCADGWLWKLASAAAEANAIAAPTKIQDASSMPLSRGKHALLHAETGSGKPGCRFYIQNIRIYN